jgi:ParB family chromosome partitioning protein
MNNGHISWKSEKRKISELNPAPYNPRELTEIQAKDLSTSLERFNLADPIIINTNNRIIGGHQRINILKQAGDIEVDVRVPSRELTEHEEKELNIRLN